MISFQQNNANNYLFKKKTSERSRFALILALSFFMMIADHHFHRMDKLRHGFSFLASPLLVVVNSPNRLKIWLSSVMATKKTLVLENKMLRDHHLKLQAQLQQLGSVAYENRQLKGLLALSLPSNHRKIGAEVLAIQTNSVRQLIVLNKGERDGVTLGQPVLDANGLMGQVIDVGRMTSTVLLISDATSAVPVRNSRSGECSILVGSNQIDQLSIIHLPKTSLVEKGDLLVTSGLGRRYPEGYPVGRVDEVINIPGEGFIRVHVSPVAALNRARLVLLIWPDENHLALTQEIDERLQQAEVDV